MTRQATPLRCPHFFAMTNDHRTSILVVDDDAKVRQLLRRCFEPEGYVVTEAASGAEMARVMQSSRVDLVTLDLAMPGEDGFTLARRLREMSDVPIIMVTGKDDPIDRVVGLEVGADDYVSKPFHVREVLARVRSVLRRYHGGAGRSAASVEAATSNEPLRFADWELDTNMRELRRCDGTPQSLTTAEYNLLEVFVRHSRKVLSRDRLMNLLHGRDWTPYDRVIDTQVSRLRKKLETEPGRPTLIKTVRGVGYMFTADVGRRLSGSNQGDASSA